MEATSWLASLNTISRTLQDDLCRDDIKMACMEELFPGIDRLRKTGGKKSDGGQKLGSFWDCHYGFLVSARDSP